MDEPILPPTTARVVRYRDIAVSAIFVAVLGIPGLLMLVGLRPPPLANRAPTSLPPMTLSALSDPAFYRTVDEAVNDAFPLRALAINGRALIDYGALGGSTNAQVILGRDGWLFLTGEVFPRCPWSSGEILATWDGIAQAFRARGIDARFAIVPDKRTAYREMLPQVVAGRSTCTDANRPSMEAGMAERSASTVDLWHPVLAGLPPDPLRGYYRLDTHWTPEGAVPGIRSLVESIEPGLWDAAPAVRTGTAGHIGDLSRLLGLPEEETAATFERPRIEVERAADVDVAGIGGIRPILRWTAGGAGRVVPGTTLIVYDSFLGIVMEDVVPWFGDSVWLHVDDLTRHPEVVAHLPPYERVIVVRSERLAYLTDYQRVLGALLDPP